MTRAGDFGIGAQTPCSTSGLISAEATIAATGVLMLLDPHTGQFIPAVGEMPKKVQMIRASEVE